MMWQVNFSFTFKNFSIWSSPTGRRFRPELDYSVYHRHHPGVWSPAPRWNRRNRRDVGPSFVHHLSAFQRCRGFLADRRPVAAANAPAFTPPLHGSSSTRVPCWFRTQTLHPSPAPSRLQTRRFGACIHTLVHVLFPAKQWIQDRESTFTNQKL